MGFLQNFVTVIASQTHEWINQQRALHLPQARPLTDSERAAFARHFSPEILSSTRVTFVEKISNPPFLASVVEQLSALGKQVRFDFSDSEGITFGECILIAGRNFPLDLLFHEMVHVEQYRLLGMPGFARAYVQGFVDSNFIYERIPLEVVAFEMSARFTDGEAFSVTGELPGWLRNMGYTS